MPDRAEQAEHAMSALMRFVVSLIIPLWALSMLELGVEYRSIWWLGTGVAVGPGVVSVGVGANQLDTVSYGKENPVCTDHEESCWQKNRRIHIVAEKKEG